MPVRLLRPKDGQAVNTVWWGTSSTEDDLRASGNADDYVELASDYSPLVRIVTTAAANASRYAEVYNMNSASAQTLTVPLTGYWPVGKVLTIRQVGTGKTTVVGAPGVTIALGQGVTTASTNGAGYIGQIIKDSPTQWTAFGGFGG